MYESYSHMKMNTLTSFSIQFVNLPAGLPADRHGRQGSFTTGLLIACFLLFTLSLKLGIAQSLNEDGTIDCTTPTEIAITPDTIIITSSGDYELYEFSHSPIIFYKETDKYTFWYKLIIRGDCELAFDIFPTNPNDLYNFFLYRHPGGNFCQGIINRSILPIRANLYKNKIARSGTGLAVAFNNNNAETSKINPQTHFYQKSHHESINAKAGEIYYLNVYHTSGDDCGHSLFLKACASPAKIQATHKPCFIPQAHPRPLTKGGKSPLNETLALLVSPQAREEGLESITADSTEAQRPKSPSDKTADPALSEMDSLKMTIPEYYIITGFIKESKKNNPLNADIKIVEESTLKEVTADISPNTGRYTAQLEKHKNYKLIFSALGYIRDSLTVKYNPVDEPKPLEINIKLENVPPGENFVLNNIYFHPNTYAYRRESRAEFKALFNFMKINDRVIIEIQGHTNGNYFIKRDKHFSHLSEEWNFQGTSKKLSQHRAETVKRYLTDNGINEERIVTRGFGGEKMIISNPINYKESLKNMRVEIQVLKI